MSPTSNPSAQLKVVLKWYEAASTWKFDVLEAQLSADYIYKTLPVTANGLPKNKAQNMEFVKSLGKSFGYSKVQYEIFQLIETPGNIWVHSRLYGNTFSDESIFIFTLSSGDNIQITAIQEFMDRKLAATLVAAASAAAAPK